MISASILADTLLLALFIGPHIPTAQTEAFPSYITLYIYLFRNTLVRFECSGYVSIRLEKPMSSYLDCIKKYSHQAAALVR